MRLDQLVMQGFGRFGGETLELAPGLNLIYGPNEAGKSTVQRFIIGMLYGQKRRGQRREYSEDAVRSRPWQGDSYRGAMLYTLEKTGQTIRIEREFDQRRDQVRIFDAVTGSDLSDRYPMDRRKERPFAMEQIGLSEEAFRATAWVGQLQVGQVEIGQELITRVGNMRDSGRDDLSVTSALAKLDDRMREIGSDRSPTRPYARLTRAIEERREELERALAARSQSRGWEAQLNQVRQRLDQVDVERQSLQRALSWALWREGQSRLDRVSEAVGRAHAARERANELAAFARFPVHLRDRLLRALAEVGSAEERAADQSRQLDQLLRERDRLGERLDAYSGLSDSGAEIAERLKAEAHAEALWTARAPELQVEADRLREQVAILDQRLEPLRPTAAVGAQVLAQLAAMDRKESGPEALLSMVARLQVVLAVILGIPALLLIAPTGQAERWGLSLASAFLIAVPLVLTSAILIGLANRGRRGKRSIEQDELFTNLGVTSGEEIRNRLVEHEQLITRRDGNQSRLQAILDESSRMEQEIAHRRTLVINQIASALAIKPRDLQEPAEQFQQEYEIFQSLQVQAERLEREVSEARRRLREDQAVADRHMAQAEGIFMESGAVDLAGFEAGCAQRAEHIRLVAEASSLKLALHAMLEGQAADDLSAEVERLESVLEGAEPPGLRPSSTLQPRLQLLDATRSELLAKASELGARVETALGDTLDTPDLEREIVAMTEERRLMDAELAALDLARTVMVSVSTEVHREFAPKLNAEIGRVVSTLTEGRYRTIRIDEHLGIRAITASGRTVDLNSLSAGTIDQFYFGLRIALLDLITNPQEPVPLILDDPFVQYDQDRLSASLEYLGQIASERQIILLTCHQREVQTIQNLGITANLITLSPGTAVD